MGGQVRHTTNSIALHLYIWAKHLTDEGLEATKFDDEQLVVGYHTKCNLFRHPHAMKRKKGRTIHSQISKRSTRSPLYLRVKAAEQE